MWDVIFTLMKSCIFHESWEYGWKVDEKSRKGLNFKSGSVWWAIRTLNEESGGQEAEEATGAEVPKVFSEISRRALDSWKSQFLDSCKCQLMCRENILLLQDPQKYSLYKPWAQSSACWWACLVHHCLDLCSVSDWVSDSGGRQDWLEDSEGLHRFLWRYSGGMGRAIPPFIGSVLVDSGCSDKVSLTGVAYK